MKAIKNTIRDFRIKLQFIEQSKFFSKYGTNINAMESYIAKREFQINMRWGALYIGTLIIIILAAIISH